MWYNPEKHQRRSIRLAGYNYGSKGGYFITICAFQNRHLFGHINRRISHLNPLGRVAEACWKSIPDHFPALNWMNLSLCPIIYMASFGLSMIYKNGPIRGADKNGPIRGADKNGRKIFRPYVMRLPNEMRQMNGRKIYRPTGPQTPIFARLSKQSDRSSAGSKSVSPNGRGPIPIFTMSGIADIMITSSGMKNNYRIFANTSLTTRPTGTKGKFLKNGV